MASNTSSTSMWLSDSESCYSQSSSDSSSYNSPAFTALTLAAERRTPSPDLPLPHGPRQAGPSLLSQGIAEMKTLQAMAADKEKFIPSTLGPNKTNPTNTSQALDKAKGKSTTTIKLPSPSHLQAQRYQAIARAEQARIDHETRLATSRVDDRQARLNRAIQHEIYINGMCFMDMSGERQDTKNVGGWDSREWACCGCEVYNLGHEFLCSHCKVHSKCGECERRGEGRLRLDLGFEEGEEEGVVTWF